MKKLALIVLLAVVASRVLSDHTERRAPHTSRPFSIVTTMFGDDDDAPQPPRPPHHLRVEAGERPTEITTVPWNSANSGSRELNPAAPPVRGPKGKRRNSPAPVASTPVPSSQAAPAWFPKSEWEEEGLARPGPAGVRVLLGRVSASPERANADLRKTVNREIADWLAADIPTTWVPPQKLVDRMVQGTHVQTVTLSLGPKPGEINPDVAAAGKPIVPELDELHTLYRAGQQLDFSDVRRAEFIESYHRELASVRMRKSGSVIAIVLAGLAMISFYVRADEATKGYYTNRLRVLAAAGVGAAGAVAYRYWA